MSGDKECWACCEGGKHFGCAALEHFGCAALGVQRIYDAAQRGGGQGFWTFERPKGVNIFSSDGILDFKEGCKGVKFQRGF